MTTTVDFHDALEADFAVWVAADPIRAADRRALLFGVYLADIRQTLASTAGAERALAGLGADPLRGWHPPAYDWPYSGDLWVRFAVRVERHLLRPSRSRCRVTVLPVTAERLAPPDG